MFRVSTLDLANLPRTPEGKVDFAQDFFGREPFLTVSGQLNVEAVGQQVKRHPITGEPPSPIRELMFEISAFEHSLCQLA